MACGLCESKDRPEGPYTSTIVPGISPRGPLLPSLLGAGAPSRVMTSKKGRPVRQCSTLCVRLRVHCVVALDACHAWTQRGLGGEGGRDSLGRPEEGRGAAALRRDGEHDAVLRCVQPCPRGSHGRRWRWWCVGWRLPVCVWAWMCVGVEVMGVARRVAERPVLPCWFWRRGLGHRGRGAPNSMDGVGPSGVFHASEWRMQTIEELFLGRSKTRAAKNERGGAKKRKRSGRSEICPSLLLCCWYGSRRRFPNLEHDATWNTTLLGTN